MPEEREVAGWGEDSDDRVELLSSSADRLGVDERATDAARRGAGFLRRHLGWTLVAVVAVAAGVAVAAYISSLPPPVSARIDISIEKTGGGGRLYVATLGTPAESVHLVGIVGPGLTNPSSMIDRVTNSGPGIGALGADINCNDETWWDAGPDDYRVSVVRTDPYGRVTDNDVPFADSPTWWQRVRDDCVARAVFELPPASADVSTEPDGRHLSVTAHVAGTNHPIRALLDASTDEAFFWDQGPSFEIPAGGTVDVPVRMMVSCAEGTPRLEPHLIHDTGGDYVGPALPVLAQAVGGQDEGVATPALIPLDQATETAINTAAAAICG